MACSANHVFHNWAQTITCKPAQFCQPATEQEVQDLVRQAIKDGKHVRSVGAGHSWAPLVLTQDVLINLDKLNQVTTDKTARTAQVQAGTELCFSVTRAEAEAMYPDTYEQFRKLRASWDPNGVFSNELVHRLFD